MQGLLLFGLCCLASTRLGSVQSATGSDMTASSPANATILTVSPTTPNATVVDPTGAPLTASFDTSSGNVTVLYSNKTVVIVGASFDLNNTAIISIGVQNGSLSVNPGSNDTLLVPGVFSNSSAAPASAPVLLSMVPDGSLAPLDVNVTAVPTDSSSGNTVIVSGPFIKLTPASNGTASSGRRLLQVPMGSMTVPENSATKTPGPSPTSTGASTPPSSPTILFVSSDAPNATVTDPTGAPLSASFDAPSGNVTVLYSNKTVVIVGATFNLSTAANISIGVQEGSVSLNPGSNVTLLLTGVFGNVSGSSPAQAPTPILLVSTPDGSLAPLGANVTAEKVPSMSTSGSTLVVTGPYVKKTPTSGTTSGNGRRLLQNSNGASAGPGSDASAGPDSSTLTVPESSMETPENTSMMSAANSTNAAPITLLTVNSLTPNATSETESGMLVASLDPVSGNLTVVFLNTTVVIYGATFNASNSPNITVGVQGDSLSASVGTNSTLLVTGAFGNGNATEDVESPNIATAPLLLSAGPDGLLQPEESNVAAISSGPVVVVTGPLATPPESTVTIGRRLFEDVAMPVAANLTQGLLNTGMPSNMSETPSGRRLLRV